VALPSLFNRKLYKTGQTRGADDDEIYQNRVGRNSTILINFHSYDINKYSKDFENGFIVLISPKDYFDKTIKKPDNLILGKNLLVFYQTRNEWEEYDPEKYDWTFATSRISPLGGQYVARIPATTSEKKPKIALGFTETKMKGAGIRDYEYSDSNNTKLCRKQLEALYWLCYNSVEVSKENGMNEEEIILRKAENLKYCEENGLLDYKKLFAARIIDKDHNTICPLCLEKLDANGFYNRMAQAEGREVLDLTITQLNLFHIKELRVGEFNHKTYNLGWGHHHCNVVVKDAGIEQTLKWLKQIVKRNEEYQNKDKESSS